MMRCQKMMKRVEHRLSNLSKKHMRFQMNNMISHFLKHMRYPINLMNKKHMRYQKNQKHMRYQKNQVRVQAFLAINVTISLFKLRAECNVTR